MKKKYLTIILTLFLTGLIFSQNENTIDEYRNRGFFNITKFGYIKVNEANLETFSPTNGVLVTDISIDKSQAFSLQTISGHFFSPYFSTGLGIGLDGYHDPNYNTLPIFLDLRFYFNDGISSPYLFTDYGTLVKVENGKNNGTIFNIGFGYKLPLNNKRLMIVTDLSYSYKSVSNDGLSIRKSESWTQIKGIMLSLGVIF